MDIDTIRYFNHEKKLIFSEYQTIFGRSFQFTKPEHLSTSFTVPLNFRISQKEFDGSSSSTEKEPFKKQIIESFEQHKTDEIWIKEIRPTIIALKSINSDECFSDAIITLETLFSEYLLAHPLSESSPEFIRRDQGLVLENIKKDARAFHFAHDSLKTNLQFLFNAWQCNPHAFYEFNPEIQWMLIQNDPTILKEDASISAYLNKLDKDRLNEIIKKTFFIDQRVLCGISSKAFIYFLQKNPDLIEKAIMIRPMSEYECIHLKVWNSENLKYFPYNIALKWLVQEPESFCKISAKLQNDKRFNLELVKLNGDALQYITTFKNDPDVVLAAITKTKDAWRHVSGLRDNTTFIASLVQKNLLPYHEIVKYKTVQEVVFAAIQHHPQILEIAESFQDDRDFILSCVSKNGRCLEYAKNFQKDEGVVLAAINQNIQALIFTSDEIRDNKEFALKAVQQNGVALEYLREYRKDEQVVLSAIKQNPRALIFADADLRTDKDFILEAVGVNGMALCYAMMFKNDNDVVLKALKQTPKAFLYLPKKLKRKEEIITFLFKEKLASLSHERALEISLEASKLVTKDTSYDELLLFIHLLLKVPAETSICEMIANLQRVMPSKMTLSDFSEIIDLFIKAPDASKYLSLKILEQIKNCDLAPEDYVVESKKLLSHIDDLIEVIPVSISDEELAIVIKKFIAVPKHFVVLNCKLILAFVKGIASNELFYLEALKKTNLITKQDLSALAIFASGSSLTIKSGWNIKIGTPESMFSSFMLPELCRQIALDFSKKAETIEKDDLKKRCEHMQTAFSKVDILLSLKASFESELNTMMQQGAIEGKKSLDLNPFIATLLERITNLMPGDSTLVPLIFLPSILEHESNPRMQGHACLMEICKQDDGKYRMIIYDTSVNITARIKDKFSEKYHPIVVKDIDASSLNRDFFLYFLRTSLSDLEIGLATKFRNFYKTIESLGIRADETEKPYNLQGDIGNCTYKCVSKFLHKNLGKDYEFAKLCIHRKILFYLKDSMSTFHRSLFASDKDAFTDALYRDKQLIKSERKILISNGTGFGPTKEMNEDEFMFYAALHLDSEIKKTQEKITPTDRLLIED